MLDFKDNWKTWDGTIPVLAVQGGTGTSQRVEAAKPQAISNREAAASNGGYTVHDLKWSIPKSLTPVFDLRPGDFLVEESNGDCWSVISAALKTHRSRWHCIGRRVQLNANKAETVRVLKPTWRKDDAAAPVASYDLFWEGDAEIQELASVLMVENERRTERVTHSVFINEAKDFAAGMRIERRNGDVLNVSRVTMKDQLASAVVLDAVTSRKPVE